jgi:hypothetical protein
VASQVLERCRRLDARQWRRLCRGARRGGGHVSRTFHGVSARGERRSQERGSRAPAGSCVSPALEAVSARGPRGSHASQGRATGGDARSPMIQGARLRGAPRRHDGGSRAAWGNTIQRPPGAAPVGPAAGGQSSEARVPGPSRIGVFHEARVPGPSRIGVFHEARVPGPSRIGVFHEARVPGPSGIGVFHVAARARADAHRRFFDPRVARARGYWSSGGRRAACQGFGSTIQTWAPAPPDGARGPRARAAPRLQALAVADCKELQCAASVRSPRDLGRARTARLCSRPLQDLAGPAAAPRARSPVPRRPRRVSPCCPTGTEPAPSALRDARS